jgi:virulence factor Mce-like protein
MNRRRNTSLAGSPLLIGAVTTLIVVVAVYLSYNANNGLPFVPTYNVKVHLPEGSGLQPSNQVRIAGTRVGIVGSLTPYQNPQTGVVTAIAELKLEKKVEPLPANTRAVVLSVSAIGLKYLELEKGTSRQTIKAGGSIPLRQTREPVDIDQLFNMFDEKTRTAIQQNTSTFGDGLAGRGLELNEAIATLKPLVNRAIPVLRNLAAPQTDLRALFPALEHVSEQAAPVAEQQAQLYVDQDTFFKAWAGVAKSLEEATVGGPPALEQAIYSLPYEAPFTEKTTEFMRLLRPSAKTLRTVAKPLGDALAEGAVNLKQAVALNTRLEQSSQALEQFTQNPIVTAGLEDFTQTLQYGNPLLAGLTPVQSYCNYITLAFRNLAALESEDIGVGTLARAGLVLAPLGPNNEGFPTAQPANGPSTEKLAPGSSVIRDSDHVHLNPYPNVGGPGQARVCEAGNEKYELGKLVDGNVSSAANVTNNRELTNRETSALGEKYSTSTLRDLGVLSRTPSKTTKKSGGKGRGK